MRKTQYKRKTTKKPKVFAKAVMNVVNKKAEVKQHTVTTGVTNLLSGAFLTWPIALINQGTNTSTIVGKKIFIKNIRLSMTFNTSNATGTALAHDCTFRLVVFRGKYDYVIGNYPSSEVFESNSGQSPNSLLLARTDRNQITPLSDQKYTVNAPATNVIGQRTYTKYIAVNKSFNLREDDTYGSFSNLYVGCVYEDGRLATDTASILANWSLTYTDV